MPTWLLRDRRIWIWIRSGFRQAKFGRSLGWGKLRNQKPTTQFVGGKSG